jgi:hypothetical protein
MPAFVNSSVGSFRGTCDHGPHRYAVGVGEREPAPTDQAAAKGRMHVAVGRGARLPFLQCGTPTSPLPLTTAFEGQYVWPLLTKKSLNALRTTAPGHSVAMVGGLQIKRKIDAPQDTNGCCTESKGSIGPTEPSKPCQLASQPAAQVWRSVITLTCGLLTQRSLSARVCNPLAQNQIALRPQDL